MNVDQNNPFVGLRPFEVDESLLFFGRNDQILELLQRLHQHHFVAVVGSSGSGKSSLLRAGLIPSLKAGYLVEDSDHWFISIMKPGQNPLYNLVESILKQINSETKDEEISELIDKIKEEGADVLLSIIVPIWKEQKINFFLLVDQFEELFRFAMEMNDANKKDEAIDFVNIMLELSQQSHVPFYVVLTMRSDFIGDCVQFNGLPEAMNKSLYLVPKLNRIQLKSVIEGPVKLYGSNANQNLTSRLLNELGKVKDELPLLQHALMRIWSYEMNINKNGELDLEDYEKIGGLEKALSNHADEALAGMNESDLNITKLMFQALTTIDENGRKIRRPIMLSQLLELTGKNEKHLLNIIEQFIKDKRCFLILNRAADTNDKVIDISHESLIRQWSTLNKWVDEEGESSSSYLRLVESFELFLQNKKDLLTGSELQLAVQWFEDFKPSSTWANRYHPKFSESIDYLEKSRLQFEKEKREKEIQQKRKLKQARIVIGIISVVGIFAIVVSIFAYTAKLAADHAKKEANKSKAKAILERTSAENNLKKFQSAQAEKVMNDVTNIISRATLLKSKYPDIYTKMIEDSKKILKEYPDNKELQEELKRLSNYNKN